MDDRTYYRTILSLLASLQVPVSETQTLRDMADLMDETTRRDKAAQANKEPGTDVA